MRTMLQRFRFLDLAQEWEVTLGHAEFERDGGDGGGWRDRGTGGKGAGKGVQYWGAEAGPVGGWREARASEGGVRARAPYQPQESLVRALPPGKARSVLPGNRPQGLGPRRRDGWGGGPEVDHAGAAALLPTSRAPRNAYSQSPTRKKIVLGKMSGFGPGDGGWSERVEGRRQQRLLQRNRGGASMVAEVDESGKIQTVAPSAPAAPIAGHHQAVSPPRLRRLVHAEVRK